MTKIKVVLNNSSESEDLKIVPEPIAQFEKWYKEAVDFKVVQPDAMFLATSGLSGQPSGRLVLLKEVNEKVLVFFTNYLSFKGKEIFINPFVSLTFHWKEMERQVRILGKASKISKKESDDYFTTRTLESKVGAIISPQSSVVPDKKYLDDKIREFIRLNKGKRIKRPAYWGGYRIKPFQFEFWQGREHRLHDRIQYRFENGKWKIERLAP